MKKIRLAAIFALLIWCSTGASGESGNIQLYDTGFPRLRPPSACDKSDGVPAVSRPGWGPSSRPLNQQPASTMEDLLTQTDTGRSRAGQPRSLAARLSGIRRLTSDRSFTMYRAGLAPAYTVKTGEIVLVECQHGLPGLVTKEGRFIEPKEGDRINPGTGPIFVEGIEPGDALAIDILDIRAGDWGYSGGRIFELDNGYAVVDKGLKLPLQPMIGQIGIVPAQGEVDSRTPAETGGNMDCKEVRAGSTLVFTAQVKGGLVGMGDVHALQGDGEIGGQGIECDAEVLVSFRELPEKLSDRPVILRPEFVATLGAHGDLSEAAWQATEDMVRLLAKATGRAEKDARMLVSLAGNLRINQIVDPARGARMEMPAWLFGLKPPMNADSRR